MTEGYAWKYNYAIYKSAGLEYDDLFLHGEYTHSWVQHRPLRLGDSKWEGAARLDNHHKVERFLTKQEAMDWVIAQLVAYRLENT